MTVEQPTLLGYTVTIVDGKPLTDRQQLAWNFVHGTPGGVEADEVGALLHERKGKHPADSRCRWCPEEGKSVLGSVALKTLVTRRRSTGRWYVRDPKHAAAARSAAPGVIATSEPDVALNPFADL